MNITQLATPRTLTGEGPAWDVQDQVRQRGNLRDRRPAGALLPC